MSPRATRRPRLWRFAVAFLLVAAAFLIRGYSVRPASAEQVNQGRHTVELTARITRHSVVRPQPSVSKPKKAPKADVTSRVRSQACPPKKAPQKQVRLAPQKQVRLAPQKQVRLSSFQSAGRLDIASPITLPASTVPNTTVPRTTTTTQPPRSTTTAPTTVPQTTPTVPSTGASGSPTPPPSVTTGAASGSTSPALGGSTPITGVAIVQVASNATPSTTAAAKGAPTAAAKGKGTTSASAATSVHGYTTSPMVLANGGWKGVSLRAATNLKVPILFGVVVALFVLVQALIDRRDPKLSRAPERNDDDTVGFQ